MEWNELSIKEQSIAEDIERKYTRNSYVTKKEFLRSLFFIGNKYKNKRKGSILK